jgi:hypothetical protein
LVFFPENPATLHGCGEDREGEVPITHPPSQVRVVTVVGGRVDVDEGGDAVWGKGITWGRRGKVRWTSRVRATEGDGEGGDVMHPSGAMYKGEEGEGVRGEDERYSLAVGGGGEVGLENARLRAWFALSLFYVSSR